MAARAFSALIMAAATFAAASATKVPATPPTVALDHGTFIGVNNGTVDSFLGIPFAKPPVGNLRLRLPVTHDPYTGLHNASAFGLACTQQAASLHIPSNADPAVSHALGNLEAPPPPSGEDCLTINVWRPAGLPAQEKLPVVLWIYGGGFQEGASASYDCGMIVNRSLALNEPIICASINYRVSALGFLGGKEVKAAGVGNIGLHDQREAMRWVQKYISAFNGDPSKVTIWGQSAGAVSVGLHLVANGGDNEGLFRGAFMESGSPIPVGDLENGQQDYDAFVENVDCKGAHDTLQCLREAPFDTIKKAMDASPSIFDKRALDLVWSPRADGIFLRDRPQVSVLKGDVANVPFVTGDCDDEGTLFALSSTDVTTDQQMRDYLTTYFLHNATSNELDILLELYPQDPTQGAPFDTGNNNTLTPQFKRMAAIQGDAFFIGPRRFLLDRVSDQQDTWSFLSKRFKSLPDLGSFHESDLANVWGGGDITDFLINFVSNLDPNGQDSLTWPKYNTSSPQLMTLLDGPIPHAITLDDFRKDPLSYITLLFLAYPI